MSGRKLEMAKARVNPDVGMACPVCGAGGARVIDSRAAADGRYVRRRRVCVSCAHRFSTYESAEHHARRAEVANIRTAHLDSLIGELKDAIERYEFIRLHPDETPRSPQESD